MKRVTSILLVAIMMFCVCTVNITAVPSPHFYGDANCDRNVDILDATEVQRHLAKITELSKLGAVLGDVDADYEISVLDATMIQRKIAKLITSFNHKDFGIYTYIDIRNLTADFDSGKAMVGVPVTFNTVAKSDAGNPLRYEYKLYNSTSETPFYVTEQSDSPELTYVFEEPGNYVISVEVRNIYDEWASYDYYYQVVENMEDDSLMISAVNKNQINLNAYDDIVITANAYGGTAPYEYSFSLIDSELQQDYSESNSFVIGKLAVDRYYVQVYVRDANGNVTTSRYEFDVEEAWA